MLKEKVVLVPEHRLPHVLAQHCDKRQRHLVVVHAQHIVHHARVPTPPAMRRHAM
jgi:hypothetical protein